MTKQVLKYLFMFVFLVLVQVFLLNYVQFSGYMNPYIYILFVLLLPVSTPGYLVLILAFILGLVIDMFSNSPGIHAGATVFMALFRSLLIKGLSEREDVKNDYPGLRQYGFFWFLVYTSIMVLLHHIFLFFFEIFSFNDFFYTLIRILFSSVLSVFIIVASQYLVFRE